MSYYEKKLWCDLKNDQERVEFLLCGRAWDTNIIARAIVEDVAKAFAYRAVSEFSKQKDMDCFLDHDPKYPGVFIDVIVLLIIMTIPAIVIIVAIVWGYFK